MISTILFWALSIVMLYVLTHMTVLNNGKKTKFFEKKTQRFLYWGLFIAALTARLAGYNGCAFLLVIAALGMWFVNYVVCSNCSGCAHCESLLCMSFSERNFLDKAIIWAIRKFNIDHYKNESN